MNQNASPETGSGWALDPRAVAMVDALYDDGRGMLTRDAVKLLITHAIRDARVEAAKLARASHPRPTLNGEDDCGTHGCCGYSMQDEIADAIEALSAVTERSEA